ncbi:14544_t:CDS:10 [Ambispora leptoticha]|uniref:DNA replication licensing factor MCM5 n=1 Tax=Ambispora leptoticha TaxID=144679 RepID=A0A9N8VUA5_9GLOM|nr:14544_t:CDS:10 [Ambispora leptoticha]
MAAIGWDSGNIYTTNITEGQTSENSRVEIEKQLLAFIRDFYTGNEHIYSKQLFENYSTKRYFLEVSMDHFRAHNESLAVKLQNSPMEILPLFELAAKNHLQTLTNSTNVPDIQIILKSSTEMIKIRDLDAKHISKLVRIPGIIIGASTLSAKAISVQIMCKTCHHTKTVLVKGGFSGIQLPRVCDSEPTDTGPKQCVMDPYVVVHDKSTFVDQQTLKIQEAPDMVPIGDIPRHMQLCADRYLTGKVSPGYRVIVMGVYDVYQKKSGKGAGVAIRNAYINVVGLEHDTDQSERGKRSWTPEEEEEMITLSKNPDLYNFFSNNIAPSIYGNQDIKKAIACLLFGGSKKILPDGMKLRGDINVLLLGDPGTAKSQLLKFVEKVAPVAIYTSGKGSSAAGLTASVIRDPQTREFYLEGGAMVLADGGVVCIDEFDKMRDEDRVAIHEAMEQQTISIAKAGITTILNSRTSVLAAANPIFGRYDDMKTPGENIDFQATILSRFDMIFLVKDVHNDQKDRDIARHVMMVHINRANPPSVEGDIDIAKMRKYINYCKAKCAPRLTEEAANKLCAHYVGIRGEVSKVERDSNTRSSIPITIRQLEAIIRIAEALAKMTLSTEANENHVNEAIRLFKKSTMTALQTGEVEGLSHPELMSKVQKVEKLIKDRLPLGSQISSRKLIDEIIKTKENDFTEIIVQRAIDILVRRETLSYSQQRKKLFRVGV